MPVTEVALLTLLPHISINDQELRAKLANAKNVMQSFTGRAFYYFEQVEDPFKIYIIGEWKSLDQHMNDFIPGLENQALLENLKDYIDVGWLQHIDTSHEDLPLPKTDVEQKSALDGQLTWTIERMRIKNASKDEFLKAVSARLQSHEEQRSLGAGWRVDKQDNVEEYVVIASWTNGEGEAGVLGPEGLGHAELIEVAHMRLLDI